MILGWHNFIFRPFTGNRPIIFNPIFGCESTPGNFCVSLFRDLILVVIVNCVGWLDFRKSQAMSGRTLRKIPFLTHANFVRRDRSPLDEFIQAMDHTVDVELKEAEMLVKKA